MAHREIGSGLHLFTSSAWQMTSLVAFLGDETLLVDPGYFPEEIAEQVSVLSAPPGGVSACAEHAGARQTLPVTLLVTHGDFDHVAAAAQLPPLKQVIGHAALRRRRGEKVRKQIEAFDRQLYVERPGPFAFPYPTVPVDGPQVREVGDERLHLFPAPGHTPDCLFALLERRGILLVGDYLSALEFPFVHDSVARYLSALALAESLLDRFRPRLLLAGHGPATSSPAEMRARLARDRRYLEDLSGGVEQAVAAGCSLRETRRRVSSVTYRGEPLAPHLRQEHDRNVALLYRALRRRKVR